MESLHIIFLKVDILVRMGLRLDHVQATAVWDVVNLACELVVNVFSYLKLTWVVAQSSQFILLLALGEDD